MPGLSDLFAPAFTRGDPTSENAFQTWMDRNFSMTNPKVEQTRSPVAFNTGNPAGMIDPEAARVLAQGGPYDMDARRNSIAQALQAQQVAAAPPPQQPQQQQNFGSQGIPYGQPSQGFLPLPGQNWYGGPMASS